MPFTVKKIKGIDTSSLDKLGNSVVDLAKYTEDEFSQVASALQGNDPDPIWNKIPPKPRRGSTFFADGTNWNPGSGQGPYWFDGAAFHPMGQNAVTGAITDAPSDGNLYGRKNAAWSIVSVPSIPIIRSYLAGLTLSTAGASTTFSVAAGQAADRTNTDYISLASAIAKNFSSNWTVGNNGGALDTGSTAGNTWYHVHLMKRPDTQVVDVAVSLSATNPTTGGSIPAAYTLSRRIGSMKTDGSSNWTAFTQFGDQFLWGTTVVDFSSVTPGVTTAVTRTITVPTGVQVLALLTLTLRDNTSAGTGFLVTSPDENDQSASTVWNIVTGPTSQSLAAPVQTRTNTSAQVRTRIGTTTAFFSLFTEGWIDRRGRDS